jgi:putative hydrolase of the HAD superfamily
MADAGNGGLGGLLVDWGGVMTTDLFASFSAFCESEGLDPALLRDTFRRDRDARTLLIDFECGRIEEEAFCGGLGEALGVEPAGLVDRLFAGSALDERMVGAVRAARLAGVRTGLLSNSWGTSRYPRELLDELFDGMVLSGDVGIRKPEPRIYELAAEAMGIDADQIVFVDDLPFNLEPARELGMATVHHTEAETTVAELERLLGVGLA